MRVFILLLLLALPAAGQVTPVTVVAVGDIACDPADSGYNGGAGTATRCHMRATSDLALALDPDAVLLLGDNQYEDGTLAKYLASYAPTWGRLKAITRPIPGNHEYLTLGARGYFDYFGTAAGDPAKGWYSFDLGGWHMVALNSNCGAVGGCGTASPQGQWLAEDLAAHPGVCTLAYWHHPRFSSGPHGNNPLSADFWTLLQRAGADLVLTGHDHGYERFAPQSGLREFVVGTGGKNHTSVTTIQPGSEVRIYDAFGVLELKLQPNGYEWRFLKEDGTALDSGRGLCNSALPSSGTDFHTLPPCRLVDARIEAGSLRSFPVAGACGVPEDAVAVAVNVTAADPTATGHFRIFPSGIPLPLASVVNFATGRTRAGSAVLPLGVAGEVDVFCGMVSGGSGSANLLVDVSGYFR